MCRTDGLPVHGAPLAESSAMIRGRKPACESKRHKFALLPAYFSSPRRRDGEGKRTVDQEQLLGIAAEPGAVKLGREPRQPSEVCARARRRNARRVFLSSPCFSFTSCRGLLLRRSNSWSDLVNASGDFSTVQELSGSSSVCVCGAESTKISTVQGLSGGSSCICARTALHRQKSARREGSLPRRTVILLP